MRGIGVAMTALAVVAAPVPAGAAAKPRPAPAARPAAARTVVIDKLAFGLAPDGLRVGDTLVFVNRDMFEHTATARDHSFDVDVKAGKSAAIKLTKAGEFPYYCRFHPGMTGVLRVKP